MKKILVVLPYQPTNKESFEAIIKIFEKNNYQIHSFDGINNQVLFVESLTEIIAHIKNEEDENCKIVVLSNLRELIFSWYRCFNDLVDEYIYYIDNNNNNFLDYYSDYSFFKVLSNFDNINSENLNGKIYFNINVQNYSEIYQFLLIDNHFEFFQPIEYFDFSSRKTRNGSYKSKKYFYMGKSYQFGETMDEQQMIGLEGATEGAITLDKKFSDSLMNNPYFAKYFLIECSEQTKNIQLCQYLLSVFSSYGEIMKIEQRERLLDEITENIGWEELSFHERLFLLSFCVLLRSERDVTAKKIMSTLLEDNEYLDEHYAMVYNILFYENHENMHTYDELLLHRRQEIIKLASYFKKKEKIKIVKKTRKVHKKRYDYVTRIAIHVDELMALEHSPTFLCLDLAKNLSRYYPEVEIKIFVEDNFIMNHKEVAFPRFYSSIESLRLKEAHKKHLGEYNKIGIYYSNVEMSKSKRTREIVREICEFDPDVIYTTSDISVAREILYPYFPIVYQSYGAVNSSTLADKYILYGESQRKNWVRLSDEITSNFIDKICILEGHKLEVKKQSKDFKRSMFEINEDDFVLVTVGNRLDVDMSEEYIDMICDFLRRHNNSRWIIIGPKKNSYLTNNFSNFIAIKKIIAIEFESDLSSFYKICDLYINPYRKGGGGSVALAVRMGLPVIVDLNSQDSVFDIGYENCVEGNNEYLEELEKMYSDYNYRNRKGEEYKKLYEARLSYEQYLHRLMDIFRNTIACTNKK